MAFRLKKIQYKNQQCSILLQNENGPCPLLAAANCLLLKQSITLPPSCIAANVVTIDELSNILVEKILLTHSDSQQGQEQEQPTKNDHGDEGDLLATTPSNTTNSNTAMVDHHIHEVCQLFPSLEKGMDVNPKFTNGPTGVEYTLGLNAFDLLGVELVHGWLIDPQDEEYTFIKDLTYNQLINSIIEGNEASTQLHNQQASTTNTNREELSMKATKGSIMKEFLDHSGHQLTQYGLTVLHEYINEGNMVVFFRNNHFNTLTKHMGHLYLLVTDFGYADVSTVVWEKLDVIDGDTEYVTGNFEVPPPIEQQHISQAATGEQLLANNLQSNSDYQLALQLSRETESTIPTNNTNSPSTPTRLQQQQQEDSDMELARQASLMEHQRQQQGGGTLVDISSAANTATAAPSTTPDASTTATAVASQPVAATPATPSATASSGLDPRIAVGIPATHLSQEERDRMLALQLQRQEEQRQRSSTTTAAAAANNNRNEEASLRLARAMQQEERLRQQRHVSRPGPPPSRQPTAPQPTQTRTAKAGGGKDSGCIIS